MERKEISKCAWKTSNSLVTNQITVWLDTSSSPGNWLSKNIVFLPVTKDIKKLIGKTKTPIRF